MFILCYLVDTFDKPSQSVLLWRLRNRKRFASYVTWSASRQKPFNVIFEGHMELKLQVLKAFDVGTNRSKKMNVCVNTKAQINLIPVMKPMYRCMSDDILNICNQST